MIDSPLRSSLGLSVAANRLSEREVRSWLCNGFLVLNEVLTTEDVALLRQAMDVCGLTHEIEKATTQVMHLDLTALHPAFLALARDQRILGHVVPLIGPDIAIEHTKLSAQPHGPGGGVRWHQDLAFYPHTNSDVLAVMVMLDDATLENGCMHMIPGSHRLGYLDHAGEDGRFSGACRDHGTWDSHPSHVAITPRAGGISIHHGHTLHASGPNNSGQPRRGLVLNYRAADAYQLADNVFADTGLMVSGSFRGNVRLQGGTIPLPHFQESWNRMSHGSAWNQVGAFAAVKNRENTRNCLS